MRQAATCIMLPQLTAIREIIDDDFLHALRIYWDPDSKAVRMQASVLRGEMKRLEHCHKVELETNLY